MASLSSSVFASAAACRASCAQRRTVGLSSLQRGRLALRDPLESVREPRARAARLHPLGVRHAPREDDLGSAHIASSERHHGASFNCRRNE
jgi:hypothetical protein